MGMLQLPSLDLAEAVTAAAGAQLGLLAAAGDGAVAVTGDARAAALLLLAPSPPLPPTAGIMPAAAGDQVQTRAVDPRVSLAASPPWAPSEIAEIPPWTPSDFASLAWGLAASGPLVRPGRAWCDALCAACLPLLPAFEARHLWGLLWGLARLSHVPQQVRHPCLCVRARTRVYVLNCTLHARVDECIIIISWLGITPHLSQR